MSGNCIREEGRIRGRRRLHYFFVKKEEEIRKKVKFLGKGEAGLEIREKKSQSSPAGVSQTAGEGDRFS